MFPLLLRQQWVAVEMPVREGSPLPHLPRPPPLPPPQPVSVALLCFCFRFKKQSIHIHYDSVRGLNIIEGKQKCWSFTLLMFVMPWLAPLEISDSCFAFIFIFIYVLH